MIHDLEDVVRWLPGITDIVEIGGEHYESSSGHIENYRSDFVCHINGTPYKVVAYWRINFISNQRSSSGIVSKDKISEADFAKHATDRPVTNTSAIVSEIERKRKIRDKLEKMTPKCPICNRQMEQRLNRKKGQIFWGCSLFIKTSCKGTRPMSVEYKALEENLKKRT